MRKWISFTCHLVLIGVMMSFATLKTGSSATDLTEIPESLSVYSFTVDSPQLLTTHLQDLKSATITKTIYLDKAYLGFKEALGFKESGGNYLAVNTLGYLGKYQFGASTLKQMGLHNTDTFIKDPQLQERMFNLNVSRNKWILRREIKTFNGKRVRGNVVTESGIIAAAHLAGAGNVKKYLQSYGKEDVADAYGSNIAYYLRKFAGFDLSGVRPKRKPRI